MTQKQNIKLIGKYLGTLSKAQFLEVINLMIENNTGTIMSLTVGCNGVPKPTNSPTPYGSWTCTASGWVWVPEFGG